MVAEYLTITDDAALLHDIVPWYGSAADVATGLAHLVAAFRYLRDRVGTGSHGLVRLWNSDWNDMFYAAPTSAPYAQLFATAESHLNSAMAAVVLPALSRQILRLGGEDARLLAQGLDASGREVGAAVLADMTGRSFARRAYLGPAAAVGEDAMWLEPQPWLLQLPALGDGRKLTLLGEIERRLMRGEVLGARQIEIAPTRGDLKSGVRENGGFWYALNGPLILGVASFDPARARLFLRRMTFQSFADHYPTYWTGRWSAADSLDASPVASAGLSTFAIWCAHAHAWPLHCYLTLRHEQPSAERRIVRE